MKSPVNLGLAKTIYQYFTDKDSLVEEVMQDEMTFMQMICNKQLSESSNAVEELFRDMEQMNSVMDAMNPQIVYDLEKFYPKTFERFKNIRILFCSM